MELAKILPYIVLVLGWIIFGLVHSLMAGKRAKRLFGLSDIHYRRVYNLIAIVLVLILLLYGAMIDSPYFYAVSNTTKAIGLMFATFGYLVAKLAFKEISISSFLGFRKEEEQELITTGIYARVRHPLYTATILVLTGFIIFSPSWTNVIHALSATIYIFIGAYYEEKKLVEIYGEKYKEYQANTPFILPKLF